MLKLFLQRIRLNLRNLFAKKIVVPTTIVRAVVTMSSRFGSPPSSLSTRPKAIAPLISPAKPMKKTSMVLMPEPYPKRSKNFTRPSVPANLPTMMIGIR